MSDSPDSKRPLPALPPMPEQPGQTKTPGQVLDATLVAATQFGRACGRGWSALDRRGRMIVGSVVLTAMALMVVAVGGLSHKPRDDASSASALSTTYPEPDPLVREAYEMQRRFAMREFDINCRGGTPTAYRRGSKDTSGFSPIEETTIVQHENRFRIKGWVRYSHMLRVYVCEMRYDPELEVWKLTEPVVEVRRGSY
jgi:hypothetical protein